MRNFFPKYDGRVYNYNIIAKDAGANGFSIDGYCVVSSSCLKHSLV